MGWMNELRRKLQKKSKNIRMSREIGTLVHLWLRVDAEESTDATHNNIIVKLSVECYFKHWNEQCEKLHDKEYQ